MPRPQNALRAALPGARTQIQIRCSPQEQAAFTARAASLGLTISEWIRLLARHDAGMWEPEGTVDAARAHLAELRAKGYR